MIKRIITISTATIMLAGCGMSTKSEEKESKIGVEEAAVKMYRTIEQESLEYPEDYTDKYEYKEKVAKLRPYVDALKNGKAKNEDEEAFMKDPSFMKRDGYIELLDGFVKTAENGSTKQTLEYFEHKETKKHPTTTKYVMYNLGYVVEDTFGVEY